MHTSNASCYFTEMYHIHYTTWINHTNGRNFVTTPTTHTTCTAFNRNLQLTTSSTKLSWRSGEYWDDMQPQCMHHVAYLWLYYERNPTMDSINHMQKCGSTLWEYDYLDNEAMNEKHRVHSECVQQEMLPSNLHRKTNSLKPAESHLHNQLFLSQLTTQFHNQMLL